MSKVSNVLTMLSLLNNGRIYSIKELANILEVSPRMVRVYKEDLDKAGIFVDTIRGPYGGYVLNKKVYIPERDYNKEKLVLSDKDRKIYNIIYASLKEHKKVKLLYESDGEVRERIIHPMDVYVYNNIWYIPAYCELRKSMRHFLFDNIIEIKLLNETHE